MQCIYRIAVAIHQRVRYGVISAEYKDRCVNEVDGLGHGFLRKQAKAFRILYFRTADILIAFLLEAM